MAAAAHWQANGAHGGVAMRRGVTRRACRATALRVLRHGRLNCSGFPIPYIGVLPPPSHVRAGMARADRRSRLLAILVP